MLRNLTRSLNTLNLKELPIKKTKVILSEEYGYKMLFCAGPKNEVNSLFEDVLKINDDESYISICTKSITTYKNNRKEFYFSLAHEIGEYTISRIRKKIDNNKEIKSFYPANPYREAVCQGIATLLTKKYFPHPKEEVNNKYEELKSRFDLDIEKWIANAFYEEEKTESWEKISKTPLSNFLTN